MSNWNMAPVHVGNTKQAIVDLDNVSSATTVTVEAKGANKVKVAAVIIASVVGVLCLVTAAIFVPLAVTRTYHFATSTSTSSSTSVSTAAVGTTTVAATTTTAATATTTVAAASPQCSSYTTINDATRLQTAAGASACDQSIFSSSTGTWVRFSGAGGTELATSAPGINLCGTQSTGWLSTALPASGATANGTVCFAWSSNTCNWNAAVLTTNCGSFYVYYLLAPPVCNARYCTQP